MQTATEQSSGAANPRVPVPKLCVTSFSPNRTTVAESPYARAREGVTRKQHFAERLNLVEQDRSTLRERYRKVSRSRALLSRCCSPWPQTAVTSLGGQGRLRCSCRR